MGILLSFNKVSFQFYPMERAKWISSFLLVILLLEIVSPVLSHVILALGDEQPGQAFEAFAPDIVSQCLTDESADEERARWQQYAALNELPVLLLRPIPALHWHPRHRLFTSAHLQFSLFIFHQVFRI